MTIPTSRPRSSTPSSRQSAAAIPGTEEIIPCDTLLLSVGLIPTVELAAKAGSRYLLVNLVARRARNIAAAAQAAGEPLDTKPVSMAIDEVYDGRLQVVHKE